MKPVFQTIMHKPEDGRFGDCHRAAVASILERPIEGVPHFANGWPSGDVFAQREREWLLTQGVAPVIVAYECGLEDVLRCMEAQNPTIFYLLAGESAQGVGHTVVCRGGKIVHDPHPSGAGLSGPMPGQRYYLATFFSSSKFCEPNHEGALEMVPCPVPA